MWTQGPAADQLSPRSRINAPHTLPRVGRRGGHGHLPHPQTSKKLLELRKKRSWTNRAAPAPGNASGFIRAQDRARQRLRVLPSPGVALHFRFNPGLNQRAQGCEHGAEQNRADGSGNHFPGGRKARNISQGVRVQGPERRRQNHSRSSSHPKSSSHGCLSPKAITPT